VPAVPAVRLSDLSVTFPRRRQGVLRSVDLELAPGEQLLVLGPSGSGKSTLLQTITGVVPHSRVVALTGSAVIFGLDTAGTTVAELSRRVGFVAQDPESAVCLPDVEQELAFPLENRAADVASIDGRIDDALALVGASALRSRRTEHVSGGEGQRVALAATLIAAPDVVLLDEPTSMLDAEGIASVRSAIGAAVGHHRPAVVLVEHRLDEYAGAAGIGGLPSRCIVLGGDGRIVADGPTKTVLRDAAPALHFAGCWLPLEAELQAVFGTPGGLGSPVVRAGLRAMAEPPVPIQPGTAVPPIRPAADPPGANAVLTAENLTVSRDEPVGRRRRGPRGRPPLSPSTAVLRGIDLTVRAGEIVAVLGANGAGKSSLLLALAGLLRPLEGTVCGPRPGMIFQNPEHQFVAATVRGEVSHGVPEAAAPLVERLLVEHRLAHLADQNPHQLSGGEKRRLSIAAMLAHDRPCLLADEPTLGLDRRATVATTRGLRAAAATGGAVVFSSHDLRTVATLATRVVVLADGEVVADGPALDVLADGAVLLRAGLTVPPLIEWLLQNIPSPDGIRRVLDALDATVPGEGQE
jgi:energy-coupling factor transporter ATP-binding protein EcfA2